MQGLNSAEVSRRNTVPFIHSLLSALLLIASLPLRAQSSSALQTIEQADAQLQRAEVMREEAQQRYAAEEVACYQKILVSGCLGDAKERHMKAIIEARQLEAPAREFKRAARRAEVEEEKDRQATERPAREAEQQERAERYRAEEAEKAADREQRQLKKERKAEEKRQKLAEERAERKLKADKRAKRHAEQIEKKAKQHTKAKEESIGDKTPGADEN
jgi:hypothetical protein